MSGRGGRGRGRGPYRGHGNNRGFRGGSGSRGRGGFRQQSNNHAGRGASNKGPSPCGFLVVSGKPIVEDMLPEIVGFLENYPYDQNDNTVDEQENNVTNGSTENVMDVATNPNFTILNGSYSDLSLKPELLKALEAIGAVLPTTVDQSILSAVINRKNLVLEIPFVKTTKRINLFATAAVQIVDNQRSDVQVVIAVRQRTVADDINKMIQQLGSELAIRSCLCVGGAEIDQDLRALDAFPHIAVGTPGRIFDLLRRGAISPKCVKTLMLDNPDKMLEEDLGEHLFKILKILRGYANVVMPTGTGLYIASDLRKYSPFPTVKLAVGCVSESDIGISERDDGASITKIASLGERQYFMKIWEIDSLIPPQDIKIMKEIEALSSETELKESSVTEKATKKELDIKDVDSSESSRKSNGDVQNQNGGAKPTKLLPEKTQQQQSANGESPVKRENRAEEKRRQYYQMQSATKHMPKPQLAFKTPVVNDDSPFIPKLPAKPHALEPLSKEPNENPQTGKIYYEHPYKTEIEKWIPPDFCLELPSSDDVYLSTDVAECLIVDTEEALDIMMKELQDAKEIAFDVEHSDRSYFGLTCLLQVSTRTKDYLVDCLELRDSLHKLNEHFANPAILKIAHDGRADVEYIQKDLGLYVVGLWDTRTAAALISSQDNVGLALLLEKYADVQTDKKFQVADWRIRPLPDDMILYARTDSRYLPLIYDQQKKQLWDMGQQSSKLISQVLQSGKGICGIRYEKPDVDDWAKRSNALNNRQRHALIGLNKWRTDVAKAEDDSVFQIASNKVLMTVAQALPVTEPEMQYAVDRANFGRISSHMREHMEQILKILSEAKSLPLIDLREEERQRKIVGRYNSKPHPGSKEQYFGAKIDSEKAILQIINDSIGGKTTPPDYITRIFPTQGGCKDNSGDIITKVKSMLAPYVNTGKHKISYDVLVNEEDERHQLQVKAVEEAVTSILPFWQRKRPAERCIVVFSSKRYCNLSIVDDRAKYNDFFLKKQAS